MRSHAGVPDDANKRTTVTAYRTDGTVARHHSSGLHENRQIIVVQAAGCLTDADHACMHP